VTNEDDSYPEYPWKYTYTFSHDGDGAALSHLVIEVSDNFTTDDIAGLTGMGLDSIKLHKTGSGNPNMPENFYGIKFNPVGDGQTSLTWSFYSNRVPVWGDFFAKDGKTGGVNNVAYNYNNTDGVETGFLDPNGNNDVRDDPDPTAPPSSGSVDYHILRPDTQQLLDGSLRIIKFRDDDRDGQENYGVEPRLEGWMFLVEGPDNYSETWTTDADGVAERTDLAPGEYTVTEINLPDGWVLTTDNGLVRVVTAGGVTEAYFGNIPEPGTLLVLAAGGGLALLRRRRGYGVRRP